MKGPVEKLLVLFKRDLREAIGPTCSVLALLAVFVIGVGRTSLIRDPEVAKILSEVLAIALTAALAVVLVQRQRTDLKKERLRHLLSLPVTPVQILFAKTLTCGLMSVVVLLVINSLWFLGHTPEGLVLGVDAVLRASVDMCLVVLLIWSLLISASALGTWSVFLVVSATLILIRDIPESFHPLTLGMPTAVAGQPLLWARVAAAAVAIVSLLVTERLLTLRPVD